MGGPYRNLNRRFLSDVMDLAIGCDLHVQLVIAPSDFYFGDAQFECRLTQIDHRGWLYVADSPTHHQCRHEDVWSVVANRYMDYRFRARQMHHRGVAHTFALDRHQRRSFTKWHSYLEPRHITRFVTSLFGQ